MINAFPVDSTLPPQVDADSESDQAETNTSRVVKRYQVDYPNINQDPTLPSPAGQRNHDQDNNASNQNNSMPFSTKYPIVYGLLVGVIIFVGIISVLAILARFCSKIVI